jgi:hypothetical protein
MNTSTDDYLIIMTEEKRFYVFKTKNYVIDREKRLGKCRDE